MTLYEYEMKMKAYNLARVDKEYDIYLSAWVNQLAGATKEKGKKQVPVFKTFEDFFDYKKRLREIEIPHKRVTPEQKKLARIAAKANVEK